MVTSSTCAIHVTHKLVQKEIAWLRPIDSVRLIERNFGKVRRPTNPTAAIGEENKPIAEAPLAECSARRWSRYAVW